jgi:hypothetical protein
MEDTKPNVACIELVAVRERLPRHGPARIALRPWQLSERRPRPACGERRRSRRMIRMGVRHNHARQAGGAECGADRVDVSRIADSRIDQRWGAARQEVRIVALASPWAWIAGAEEIELQKYAFKRT